MRYAGLVLAAGAGVRAGGPKALKREPSGPEGPVSDSPANAAGRAWVEIAAASLRDAGCFPVLVVLGAAASQARELVPEWARVVVAEDWSNGQSASLTAGLDALEATAADGVLVTLVDLPWQGVDEALAVLSLADAEAPAASLARLTVRGTPAHPVLIGRDHWAPLRDTLQGDSGARDYLASASVATVEPPTRESRAFD